MKTVSHRSKKLSEPPTQQEMFKEVLLAKRMIPDKNLDLHKGMQGARKSYDMGEHEDYI